MYTQKALRQIHEGSQDTRVHMQIQQITFLKRDIRSLIYVHRDANPNYLPRAKALGNYCQNVLVQSVIMYMHATDDVMIMRIISSTKTMSRISELCCSPSHIHV